MIDYTQLRTLLDQSIQTQQAALTDELKAAFLQSKLDFIKSLAPGDLLQGTVVETEGAKLSLQLQGGFSLPVQLAGKLNLNQMMLFEVVDVQEGKIIIKPEEQLSLQDKALQALQLPQTQGMRTCVESFLDQALPLERQMLLKSYVLHTQQGIPYPVLTNLASQTTEGIGVLWGELSQFKNTDFPGQIQQLKESLFTQGELPPSVWQTNQEKLFEVLSERLPRETLTQLLKDHLPQELKENLGAEEKTLANELIRDIFKNVNTEELVKVNEKLYRHLFEWEPNQLKNKLTQQGIAKGAPLHETLENFNRCLKTAATLQLAKGGKELVVQLQEQQVVAGKLQDLGHYMIIPFVQEREKVSGELYFFTPHKKGRQGKKNFYAVVALEMPSIKHIEVHIHQDEKQLQIDFFVANDVIRQLLVGRMYDLVEKLNQVDYQVERWGCQVKDETHAVQGQMKPRTGFDIQV